MVTISVTFQTLKRLWQWRQRCCCWWWWWSDGDDDCNVVEVRDLAVGGGGCCSLPGQQSPRGWNINILKDKIWFKKL